MPKAKKKAKGKTKVKKSKSKVKKGKKKAVAKVEPEVIEVLPPPVAVEEEEEEESEEEEEEFEAEEEEPEEEEEIEDEEEDEDEEEEEEDEEEEDEEEEDIGDVFSELFPFALTTDEGAEKYVELSPIEQARQHRKDFDLKIPKCILNRAEVGQLFTVFDLIDHKNRGFIGHKGVTMVFRAMGIEPTEAEVSTAIAAVSKHKKGKVSFKEFLSLIKNKVEERDDVQGLRKGFESMDFKKRKALGVKEVNMAAKLLGVNLEREEAEDMIKQSDLDGDGVVNFDDFCKTLNKLNIYI